MNSNCMPLTAVLAALSLCVAVAAHATSKSCGLNQFVYTCKTGIVSANASSHHIHAAVSPFMEWYVRDVDTNVKVAKGTAGLFGKEKTITGLYGRYEGSATGAVAAASIGGGITIHNE
jgi:hypothetical protein